MSPRTGAASWLALLLLAPAATAQLTYDAFLPTTDTLTFRSPVPGEYVVDFWSEPDWQKLRLSGTEAPRASETIQLQKSASFRGYQFELAASPANPTLKIQRGNWRRELGLQESLRVDGALGVFGSFDGSMPPRPFSLGETILIANREYEIGDLSETEARIFDVASNRERTLHLSAAGLVRKDLPELGRGIIWELRSTEAGLQSYVQTFSLVTVSLVMGFMVAYGALALEYFSHRAPYPVVPRWERYRREKRRRH